MNLHLVWANLKQPFFLVASMLSCCLFALCSYLCLSEWWMVYIRQKTLNYIWGTGNNNPWYFESPQLYGRVMFMEGLVMLCLLALTTYLILKKRRKAAICLLLAGLFMICLIVYDTQIV